MKPFTKSAAVVFTLLALIHIYRLITQFKVVIGDYEVPATVSLFFAILGIVLGIGLWKESKVA